MSHGSYVYKVLSLLLFFFNDTATTEIYTLSLHDALPILQDAQQAIKLVRENAAKWGVDANKVGIVGFSAGGHLASDRKSTRLNSSHANISYAVFCLKKKRPSP